MIWRSGFLSVILPRACLICISQILATLRISWFPGFMHSARAAGPSRLGLSSHQMKAWVSRITVILFQPKNFLQAARQNPPSPAMRQDAKAKLAPVPSEEPEQLALRDVRL